MLLDRHALELRNYNASYRHPTRSLTSCEQLVTDDFLHNCPGTALAEYMIAAIDYMHAEVITQPLDRRAALQFKEINSRLAARKHENDPYSSPVNLLEF